MDHETEWERRRKSSWHYWQRANNARLTAAALWLEKHETVKAAGALTCYTGLPSAAFQEGFNREAAIALELIIKAVIAARIETGSVATNVTRIRPVHDLDTLWQDAGLPRLTDADRLTLYLLKSILHWAGRYPAPSKDEHWTRDVEAIGPLLRRKVGNLPVAVQAPVVWEDFDRLYGKAHTAFAEMQG